MHARNSLPSYLATAAALLWVNTEPGPSDVRVRNDTGIVLRNVSIEGTNYGDMAPGSITGYSRLPHARRFPIFSLTVGAIGMAGGLVEPPSKILGAGKFTYVIAQRSPGRVTQVPPDFDIHAERD